MVGDWNRGKKSQKLNSVISHYYNAIIKKPKPPKDKSKGESIIKTFRGWSDGKAVNSVYWSYKGPEIGSQCTNPTPEKANASGLRHRHSSAHTQAHDLNNTYKYFKNKNSSSVSSISKIAGPIQTPGSKLLNGYPKWTKVIQAEEDWESHQT